MWCTVKFLLLFSTSEMYPCCVSKISRIPATPPVQHPSHAMHPHATSPMRSIPLHIIPSCASSLPVHHPPMSNISQCASSPNVHYFPMRNISLCIPSPLTHRPLMHTLPPMRPPSLPTHHPKMKALSITHLNNRIYRIVSFEKSIHLHYAIRKLKGINTSNSS